MFASTYKIKNMVMMEPNSKFYIFYDIYFQIFI